MTDVWTKHGHLHELAAAVRRYVWGPRVGDFAILATIPVLGFAYGIERLTSVIVLESAELAAAALLLLVHIFALNDWADYHLDGQARPLGNPPRASRSSLLSVSVISLACFIALLWSMSPPALAPAACVIIASAIYSLQWPIRGKEILLLSSALHAICGAASFLLGLTVAAGLSTRWSNVWVFLALSMAAGHIHQELSDHREDLASRARTHATVLGPHGAFVLGQLCFVAAFLALLIPAGGAGAGLFRLLVALAWAANLALAIACWRDGVTPESVDRYRSRYRLLFVLIGIGLLLRAPAFRHLEHGPVEAAHIVGRIEQRCGPRVEREVERARSALFSEARSHDGRVRVGLRRPGRPSTSAS